MRSCSCILPQRRSVFYWHRLLEIYHYHWYFYFLFGLKLRFLKNKKFKKKTVRLFWLFDISLIHYTCQAQQLDNQRMQKKSNLIFWLTNSFRLCAYILPQWRSVFYWQWLLEFYHCVHVCFLFVLHLKLKIKKVKNKKKIIKK